VVSVDAKKKEQLGQLPAAGREWRPKGDPVPVEDHSFFSMGPEMPLAIPYGVYDLGTDAGWVNVGVDHDTSRSPSPRSAAGGAPAGRPTIRARPSC
jgi:hypothetical protein